MDTVSAEQRSRNMARIKSKNTTLELRVRSLLHRLGYRFRLHRRDLPGTPDIIFPGKRSVIFIHGCFWHGHTCLKGALPTSNSEFWKAKISKNIDRDKRTLSELKALGWRVLVVWQCDTKRLESLQERLVEFLKTGTIE
jgi:DNA mismatch endonuclease, patch repair protein